MVADLAYIAGRPTALIEAASGARASGDRRPQVLAAETGAQFRLMTGMPLPPDAVRVALG